MMEGTTAPVPRIAAIGFVCWNDLAIIERFPRPGESSIVIAETGQPGGTTTNTAVGLARLGAHVSLAGFVGDDATGEKVRSMLNEEGVDTRWIGTRPGERTDRSTIIVSHAPPERTLLWHQGAHIVHGDRLDITAIFDHDLVILDVGDVTLRRFLLDLPAHTAPRARLLGPLGHLSRSGPETLELTLRHDAVVGTERELCRITEVATIDAALSTLQQRMRGANLRIAAITRAEQGCIILTPNAREAFPAYPTTLVDPTGAGDAFAAGFAFGLAQHWELPRLARFANAMGALAIRGLGAQASLPGLAEVMSLSEIDPATLGA